MTILDLGTSCNVICKTLSGMISPKETTGQLVNRQLELFLMMIVKLSVEVMDTTDSMNSLLIRTIRFIIFM